MDNAVLFDGEIIGVRFAPFQDTMLKQLDLRVRVFGAFHQDGLDRIVSLVQRRTAWWQLMLHWGLWPLEKNATLLLLLLPAPLE